MAIGGQGQFQKALLGIPGQFPGQSGVTGGKHRAKSHGFAKDFSLLHDTTWRAHPDYRAEACFDNATRANLGGLDHPGRVFLGLSLLHRYKNSHAGSRLEPLFRLLTDVQIQDAEVLGKAMRFGAMFAAGDPALAGRLAWNPKKRLLELHLTKDGHDLYGEVAQARFASLALAMRAEIKVVEPA